MVTFGHLLSVIFILSSHFLECSDDDLTDTLLSKGSLQFRVALVPLFRQGLVGLQGIPSGEAELEEDDLLFPFSEEGQADRHLLVERLVLGLTKDVIVRGSLSIEDFQLHLDMLGLLIDGGVDADSVDRDEGGDIRHNLSTRLQFLQEFHIKNLPVVLHIELLGDSLGQADEPGVAGGMDDVHLIEVLGDASLHPPAGIGGEAESHRGIILLDGGQHTHIGFLDEVFQEVRVAGVGLGDCDCELGHLVEHLGLCPLVTLGDAGKQGDLLFTGERTKGTDFLEVDVDVLVEVGVVDHVYVSLGGSIIYTRESQISFKKIFTFLHSGLLPGGPGVLEVILDVVNLLSQALTLIGEGGVTILHPGLEDDGIVMEGDICLVLVVLLILGLDASDLGVHGGRDAHLPLTPVTVDGDMEGGIGHVLLLDIQIDIAAGGEDVGEDLFFRDAGLNHPVGETDRGEDRVEGLIEGLGNILDLLVEGAPLGLEVGNEQLALLTLLEVPVGDEVLLILGDVGDVLLDFIEKALKVILGPGEMTLIHGTETSHISTLVLLTSDFLIVFSQVIEFRKEAVVSGDDVCLFHGAMSFNLVSLSFLLQRYNKKTRPPNFSALFLQKNSSDQKNRVVASRRREKIPINTIIKHMTGQ